MPENLAVYPEMYVTCYLEYAAELKGLQGVEKQRKVKRVIQAANI